MVKHNWVKLKSKYLSGNYKDLKEFAEKEKLNYQVLRNNSKGWNDEKLHYNDIKVTKITQRTIEKVVEKEADRNARFLAVSDLAMDAIEEYFANKHHKKHVVKYKYMNKYGKLEKEELTSVDLDVADTKALSNMVSSLDKIQKGHRLALGLDKETKHDHKGNDQQTICEISWLGEDDGDSKEKDNNPVQTAISSDYHPPST